MIKSGVEVNLGDILVGKMTPKPETDFAPEGKLVRAIFRGKAVNVKDTSLVAPAGCYGTVKYAQTASRAGHEREDISESECRVA
jgi:DNA-directed RNA polymerase subunit beta